MKRLLATLLFLIPNVAWATCSSVPYTFTPNTLAQSGQVNANFAAVVSCANNIDTGQITTGVLPVARGGTNNGTWTAGSIVFASATTQLGQDNANLFWDSTNKRVGIGTNVPATSLDVSGTDNVDAVHVYDTAKTHFFLLKPETASGNGQIGYWMGSGFGTITLDGSIGIGKTPSVPLDVNGQISTSANINVGASLVFPNGDFISNPVAGSIRAFVNGGSSYVNFTAGELSAGGVQTAGSATACWVNNQYVATIPGLTICASDARLKNVGTPLSSAVAQVKGLKPINYTWKAGDNTAHVGFVAQDVQKVMPECVNTNPDGYYGLDSNCLIAHLTKAVQEILASRGM